MQYAALFTGLAVVAAMVTWASRRPVVTAHVLDARHGHCSFRWRLGHKVPRSALADFVQNGLVFVVVAYDGGVRKPFFVSRAVWHETRRALDEIDAAAEVALRRAIAEIDELQRPNMMDSGARG
jgi:hypothetical protein